MSKRGWCGFVRLVMLARSRRRYFGLGRGSRGGWLLTRGRIGGMIGRIKFGGSERARSDGTKNASFPHIKHSPQALLTKY